jgi:Protein of unknown function (DUF2971)
VIPEPARWRGTHVYKYGRVSQTDGQDRLGWLKTILLEHKLYGSNAGELNDPQEARPLLQPISLDDIITFYQHHRLPRIDMSQREFALKLFIANIISRSSGGDRLRREATDGLHKALDKFRLYSMSKRWDNTLMWAHYSDCHRGYCLEFKNEGWFAQAREVIYGDAPQMDINNEQHATWFWFYYKRAEWSNEEELRIMLPTKYEYRPFFPLAPRLLTRIILGKDMDSAVAAQIRRWAQERIPELSVTSTEYDPYGGRLKLKDITKT